MDNRNQHKYAIKIYEKAKL
jgi:serine/threonine protein kinase